MSPPREEKLFELALEKPSEERPEFLDAVCGDDSGVRQRVEALLAAHDAETGFLPDEAPTESSATLLDESSFTEGSGTQIGRYKLLEKLGEGGFGSVWAAEQKEPVRRRVALKIIKLGMDTKQVVARFEAERQALALMDHPNIAKVLDAGSTDTGRPYFAMELVKGVAITKYCNQEKLDTSSRLDLFIKVCQAIQHAHQKGIIHRDIKPSNVMITLHDGVPVPMVIDFGIAKATQQELTEKTIYTQYSQFIGTPAYMSPEQAEMSGLDIDTRSDIYSLGVLLYELLTNSTPFDSKELMQSGIDEMRRIIREQEPQRPSTKMATLEASDRTTTAEQRSADLPRLINLLKGDLDWIVMKCLEKDRTRRYDTANGLAADINRHLANEPVLARPPSAAYKFQKAWRRNKLTYSAALAVAAALIIGFTFSAWQATVATRAKIEAETSQQKAEAAEGSTQKALVLTESARDQAIRSADKLRKQIYVSDIGLAHRAVEDGDLGRAQALLGKHRPEPGMEDLRGFEWRHLWSQSQGNFDSDLGPYIGYLSGVTISPDAQFVALNRNNPPRLEIIHLASGSVAKSMDLPGIVVPLAYSPSGNFLIGQMHGTQNQLVAWDTRTWKSLEPIPLTPPFAFGYRGEQEIVVARDGDQLSMWDVTHWQTLGDLENKEPNKPLMDPSYGLVSHMVNVLAVSSDSSVAYLAGASKMRRWDLNQRTELPPLNVEGMACLATSDDGQLAGADAIGNVVLIHPHSGEILYESKSHTAWTMCLSFTRDGTRLVSANQDRNLVVHDTVNRSIVGRLLGHQGEVTALDVSADGQTVISGNGGGRVLRWSLANSGDKAFDLGVVNSSSVLKDGRILLLRDDARDLEYYDPMNDAVEPARAERLVQAMRESKVNPIAFSPTARWAISINGSKLAVWNIFTGELERSLAHPSGIIGGALFSPDGKLLVTDSETETRLWQTDDWTSEPLGPNVASHLNWGSFSQGNKRAAIAAENGSVHVYDIEHEPREIVPKNKGGTFYSVALSNNGRWLAAGGSTIRIWDLESKTLEATLRGHLQGVMSLSFSPDDRTMVSSTGTKLIFWNVATWQELMRDSDEIPARIVSIPRVEFSPNNRYLSRVGTHIGEAGIRIRTWQAPSFEEIEAMESHKKRP